MKEENFISKNIEKWRSLEAYNERLAKKGIESLNQAEIKEFTGLYRNLSHNLAYSRANFPQSNVTAYLNQIIGSGHNHIFVREKKGADSFKSYFTKGFPALLDENIKYLAASFFFFISGFIFLLILSLAAPGYSEYFFPGISAGDLNIEPDGGNSWIYPFFSSFIMTNNIRVSLLAFALGLTAGVGTVYVLFYNGMVLGALSAIVISGGASQVSYWAMILPHGFIELTAIFISGAAGLMIGRAILVPGQMRRKDSLIKAGKNAAYFIPAIVIMLIIAGLIEGYFTPLAISPYAKLAFAFVTLAGMAVYFFLSKKSLFKH